MDDHDDVKARAMEPAATFQSAAEPEPAPEDPEIRPVLAFDPFRLPQLDGTLVWKERCKLWVEPQYLDN